MSGPAQLVLDLAHRPALGRADFLVSPVNREAVEWIDRWPDWNAHALVLIGPAGAGKSHLAEVWRSRAHARRIEADHLGSAAAEAIRAGEAAAVVDGADEAALDQEALLHLYNALRERRGHLLITARRAPARWPLTLDDLRSRLVAAPAVALGDPDDALLAAVIVKSFADRQVDIGVEVVNYLVGRIERSFAAAQGIVAALDAAALARKRRITVPLIRESWPALPEAAKFG